MKKTKTNEFYGLGLAPKLLEILDKNNFTSPTPIQKQAIPVALAGKDLMGIAQTGTGKTLAFGLPMLQRIAQTKGRGLVVVPTRELALQVNQSLEAIGKTLGLKTTVLIGGEPQRRQIISLRRDPHIVIATPGRLIDHMQQKNISLQKVNVLVLDEADRMLDMGFSIQLKEIIKAVPADRQTLLFSATMPTEIISIATAYMKLPVRVEVAPSGTTIALVSQEIIFVHRSNKLAQLKKILAERRGSTLIFCRTKHGAKSLTTSIRTLGLTAAEIHSNRSLAQRIDALEGFKVGKYKILVATDIAARGIDVSNIELVLNYDLPENPEDYVHRIGRTGRAGRPGHAISLATPEQLSDVRSIERLIRKQLTTSGAIPTNQTPKNKHTGKNHGRPYGRHTKNKRSSFSARRYGRR